VVPERPGQGEEVQDAADETEPRTDRAAGRVQVLPVQVHAQVLGAGPHIHQPAHRPGQAARGEPDVRGRHVGQLQRRRLHGAAHAGRPAQQQPAAQPAAGQSTPDAPAGRTHRTVAGRAGRGHGHHSQAGRQGPIADDRRGAGPVAAPVQSGRQFPARIHAPGHRHDDVARNE